MRAIFPALSSLLFLVACGHEPAAPCDRAIDHGIELIKAAMASGPSLRDTCAAMPEEAVRCFVDAKTSADVLACSEAAQTAPITLRPGGAEPDAARQQLCKQADENTQRVQLAAVDAGRAGRIAACKADGGKAAACQIAAKTAADWAACEPATQAPAR